MDSHPLAVVLRAAELVEDAVDRNVNTIMQLTVDDSSIVQSVSLEERRHLVFHLWIRGDEREIVIEALDRMVRA
jgi:hypothetical protein